MTWLWGLLTAVALLWPSKVTGPLDGVPLDRATEAVVLGIVVPALFWFDRSFLNRRSARVLVVCLLAWKAFTAVLVQEGWCVTLIPARPYVKDGTGRPHSWDVRADWRSPDPTCSAVMTRSYWQMDDFPVWFFNLPAADGDPPRPEDVPPGAVTRMLIHGTLTARRSGLLRVATSPSVIATARIDGQPVPVDRGAEVSDGSHAVVFDVTLVKSMWRFEILWNGDDAFARVMATESPPSALDRLVAPWGRWVSPLLVATLLGVWVLTALAGVLDRWRFAWTLAAGVAMGLIAAFTPERHWQWAVLALAASGLLPLAPRTRNVRGAFLLVGVPWLVLVVVATKYDIGRLRFAFEGGGNDWWEFQRYAYRIVLQGYWLEGGEKTFWFQPLYRWIAGLLHLVFGDSSVGEEYWNGACLTVMALFSFHVTKVFAGVRWGLVAAALTLGLFVAGPGFVFIQNGLAEVTSAGFIYLAAFLALRSRRGSYAAALAAGICAVLGFYTRLNNFPMALAVAVFAWPIAQPMTTILQPTAWFRRTSLSTFAIVVFAIGLGLVLFAWRTYHYTGVFSVAKGTALDPERGNARMLWAHSASIGEWLRLMYDSVMMVLMTTDPPHVHVGALPLVAAAAISVAAVTGLGPSGALPLPVVLFMLSAIAGSLVARGTAYPGRFSIHLLGAGSAVFVCTLAEVGRRVARRLAT